MKGEGQPGQCLYCGLAIVRHGEPRPVWYHAACAAALLAMPEAERSAAIERRRRAREQEAARERAGAEADANGAPMLPFGL